MAKRYYLDLCIWIDYLENRNDRLRPLGEWAFRLIKKIISDESNILYSCLLETELRNYTDKKIKDILGIVPQALLVKVGISSRQIIEASSISKITGIPKNDAIHAILARDNGAVLVSRDNHFYKLGNITVKKPEDLI